MLKARNTLAIIVTSLALILTACGTNTANEVSQEELTAQACSWSIVKKSSRYSSNAKVVQYLLRSHGYSLSVDGYYGNETVGNEPSG